MNQLEPSRERSLLWLLALKQFTLIMDFMVFIAGRMIPMQALLTTVPEPAKRGAF